MPLLKMESKSPLSQMGKKKNIIITVSAREAQTPLQNPMNRCGHGPAVGAAILLALGQHGRQKSAGFVCL